MLLICCMVSSVRVNRTHVNIDLTYLFGNGKGCLSLNHRKPELGSIGVIASAYGRPQRIYLPVPASISKYAADVAKRYLSKGVNYVSTSQSTYRLNLAREAYKFLTDNLEKPPPRMYTYMSYPERVVNQAASDKKIVQKLNQMAKTSIVATDAFERAVLTWTITKEEIPDGICPVAGMDGLQKSIIGRIGVTSNKQISARNCTVVDYLKRADRGFVGDLTDDGILRFLEASAPYYCQALIAMGISAEVAATIDINDMLDSLIPETYNVTIPKFVELYCDLRTTNLVKLVDTPIAAVSLIAQRKLLLIGLVISIMNECKTRIRIETSGINGDTL